MAPIKLEESDASMRARLVESLSQSFPGSALSRALHAMAESDTESDCDFDLKDPLSNSCFSEIRLDKVKMEPEDCEVEDEELTSLSWLQDNDLLKNLSSGDRALCASPLDDIKENNEGGVNSGGVGQAHPPHVPYNPHKHVNSKPPYSFSCLIFMAIEDSPLKKLPVKDIYNWILTHFPYFQNAPTGWKNSVRHNLSLNKCFKKVEKEKGQGIGKGSLWCIDPDFRPNLLQALRKTPYHPYHQLQMLSNAGSPQAGGFVLPDHQLNLSKRCNLNSPSPHLFPFLSRRLAQSKSEIPGADDIDVANTLVSLKRAAESRRPLQCRNGWGSRSRSPSPPEFGSEQEKLLLKKKIRASKANPGSVVVTSFPSDDHTYSITEEQLRALMDPNTSPPRQSQRHSKHSPGSSIDEEYDFGSDTDDDDVSMDARDMSSEESDFESASDGGLGQSHGSDLAAPFKLRLRLRNPDGDGEAKEKDEKSKMEESAEALLHLAGIMTSSGSASPTGSASSNNNNNNNSKTASPRHSPHNNTQEEEMDQS